MDCLVRHYLLEIMFYYDEARKGCKPYSTGHHYDGITENLSFSKMGVVGKFMWDNYGLRKYENRQLHAKIRRYYDKHKTLEGFHE